MTAKKLLDLPFGKWELRIIKWLAPVLWVFMAYAACQAFRTGNIGSCITSLGIMMSVFALLVGPSCWGIVEEGDTALRKVLAMVTLLGFMTLFAGGLIQLIAR